MKRPGGDAGDELCLISQSCLLTPGLRSASWSHIQPDDSLISRLYLLDLGS